jgi:hypothetical protein
MKKTTYYNVNDIETELEIFINTKDEITFSSGIYDYNGFSISLTREDVKELIIDLLKMLKQIEEYKKNDAA